MARFSAALAGAVVALSASAASAQSKRYPAPAKDADRELDQRSELWEAALDPERKPYDELVRDARRLLDEHTVDAAREALVKLDVAVQRVRTDYRARAARGRAELILAAWDKCAADLELADVHDVGEPAERDAIELDLGVCQARAGHYADAERTLLHAVSIAPHGEQWMRLGEVRIALGKLDEAVDALTAALEARDGVEGTIHWLLAVAYDRARKATAAEDEARRAIQFDAAFNLIVNPTYPWLRAGEEQYLLGLAYRTPPILDRDQARPELALLYFRAFLKRAPDSPWRRRAEDHLRELAAQPFPRTVFRTQQSTSLVDPATLAPIVQKAMPQLRACLAKLPATTFAISILKTGPRTPESARDRPRYTVPEPAVKVTLDRSLEEAPKAAEDAARACLEPLAARLALPPPKDRDTYYQVAFYVVAP